MKTVIVINRNYIFLKSKLEEKLNRFTAQIIHIVECIISMKLAWKWRKTHLIQSMCLYCSSIVVSGASPPLLILSKRGQVSRHGFDLAWRGALVTGVGLRALSSGPSVLQIQVWLEKQRVRVLLHHALDLDLGLGQTVRSRHWQELFQTSLTRSWHN